MSEDPRAQYLSSGTGEDVTERDRLDLIRSVLAAEATWAEPPPEVADSLIAVLAQETAAVTPTRPSTKRWPLVAAVAGGIVAAFALVLSTISVLDREQEILVAMTGTELEEAAWGEAAVRPTEAGWWIRLDVKGLPPAPEGSYYEGWVWSDSGEGVSIGTFHLRGSDTPVVLWSGVPLAEYPSIWVTLENEDEGPEASDLVVMTGRIPEPAEG